MTVFGADDFDDHEQVVFASDPAAGLRAIIAIHDTTLGPSGGGCRMYPYASEADALRDALRLSRAMTYKFALADLGYGGAKGVIIGDPARDKSEALFRAFGRAVDNLGGRYTTGEDVGTTLDDMAVIRKETRHVAGIRDGSGDTSPPTAHGVLQGIRAAVRHRLGRDGLAGVRVAVQGLGNVGMRLCRDLAGDGASLFVTDIRAEAVSRAVEELGATAVLGDAIFDLEVDVFAPCALGGVLDDATVPRLKAAVVAGCANNQLADDRHGAMLAERGILYAPDYVINAGGAINACAGGKGYDREAVYRRIDAIADTLAGIFARADREGAATVEIANRMAAERIGRKREERLRERGAG